MLRKILANPTDHESVPDGKEKLAVEVRAGADKGADKGVDQGVDPLRSHSKVAAGKALVVVEAATSDHGIGPCSQARLRSMLE